MPTYLKKLGEKTKKNPGSSLSSAQFLVGFCVGGMFVQERGRSSNLMPMNLSSSITMLLYK
jgi:hypothetical protein